MTHVINHVFFDGCLGEAPMSWVRVKTKNGMLKIKPRWHIRWAERQRLVRVYDLGIVLVTWWSRDDIERYG